MLRNIDSILIESHKNIAATDNSHMTIMMSQIFIGFASIGINNHSTKMQQLRSIQMTTQSQLSNKIHQYAIMLVKTNDDHTINSRYDTGLRNPNRRIDTLNTLLSKSPYLVQGQFSLADVAVASYLLYVIQFFPDVELYQRWPHVVRYMRKCAGREGYGQAFGGRVQGYCLERLEKMMESGNGGEEKKKMFGLF